MSPYQLKITVNILWLPCIDNLDFCALIGMFNLSICVRQSIGLFLVWLESGCGVFGVCLAIFLTLFGVGYGQCYVVAHSPRRNRTICSVVLVSGFVSGNVTLSAVNV